MMTSMKKVKGNELSFKSISPTGLSETLRPERERKGSHQIGLETL